MRPGVPPGNTQRRRADFCCKQFATGPLAGDRHGNGPAAGAQVGDAPRLRIGRNARQGRFDQQFCLRPGNQYVRCHFEIERPEFPTAGEIGNGLALAAGAAEPIAGIYPAVTGCDFLVRSWRTSQALETPRVWRSNTSASRRLSGQAASTWRASASRFPDLHDSSLSDRGLLRRRHDPRMRL